MPFAGWKGFWRHRTHLRDGQLFSSEWFSLIHGQVEIRRRGNQFNPCPSCPTSTLHIYSHYTGKEN